ncbi:hypothetical protein [[Eubacterium] cellulosolvens]
MTFPNEPPVMWREHWFEHDQILKLQFYNDRVAVYFDDDVDKSEASWLYEFLNDIVVYIETRYGDIGTDRLYAIFHQGRYSGGHVGYYYSSMHDYRNVIDLGCDDWTRRDGWVIDGLLHEVAHIVESTIHGKKNSPAFLLWGDSKWAEFFEYAFHAETGNDRYAQKKFDEFIEKNDGFPRPNTYWFRDWFYPLYRDHGGSQIMKNFFNLVKLFWNYENRDMNWGEYIHFMNKAGETDFRSLAAEAFGWPSSWESQYQQALLDFQIVI